MVDLRFSSLQQWLLADGAGKLFAFRGLVVICQAATILITWPLWQVREHPPLLPAAPMPQFDMGPWLLLSLPLVLVMPRLGFICHAVLLLLAMFMDQTRMQPECISLALLMLGTLDSRGCALVARAHLIAIWFFAGFHKLVSPDYYTNSVPRMFVGVFGDADPWPFLFDIVRGLIAISELSLGVLAVIPRTRRLCAVLVCVMHLGILLYLMLRLQWNEAVWPWNIALSLAGFALISPWRSSLRADFGQYSWLVRAAAAFVLISPLAYYPAWLDPYLAHCLYSSNLPRATLVTASGQRKGIDTFSSLIVPFPPAHRLFEAYFSRIGRPGDRLIIDDPRWWARVRGFAHREIEYGQRLDLPRTGDAH